jgi:hypothetical protein
MGHGYAILFFSLCFYKLVKEKKKDYELEEKCLLDVCDILVKKCHNDVDHKVK